MNLIGIPQLSLERIKSITNFIVLSSLLVFFPSTIQGFLPLKARELSLLRKQNTRMKYCPTLLSNALHSTIISFSASSTAAIPEKSYFDVRIVNDVQEAEGLRLVTMEVPDEVASRYTSAGQYVKLRQKQNSSATKPVYLAIVSPPLHRSMDKNESLPSSHSVSSFTFLVKQIPQHEFIFSPSSTLEMSIPEGDGFPVDFAIKRYNIDFPVMNVLIFATGSGIAPIASAIESGKLFTPNPLTDLLTVSRSCKLYYGVKTPRHLAFEQSFDNWRSKGIEIIPVLSQPRDNYSAGWKGKTGYIQDVLKEDGIRVPRNTAALLCGQK